MTSPPPLLGAYAAKQCPYRLFREYDPTEPAVPSAPDDALQLLFDDGIAFEAQIVEQIVELYAERAVAIPGRTESDADTRRGLTDDALAAGTPIILGALMQHDLAGRRLGEVDILVATGATTSAGKPGYRAIDVKSHRCTKNLADGDSYAEPAGAVHDLQLLDPVAVAGLEPKYREDDSLQLAHYHRLLQAHGHAEADGEGAAWGGILGMEGVVAWFDLERPAFSTLTPQEQGDAITFHRRSHSTKRTALDRYDFEFDFRLRVVDTAVQRTSRAEAPMVHPISVKECNRCPWYEPCHVDLAAVDDVSLVKAVGYPDWRVHRFMGVETVAQLAALDLDEAVDRYADTPLGTKKLVEQIEGARAAAAGEAIVRDGWDPAAVPRGDVEIDLDLENETFVYLWGARLTAVPSHWPEAPGTYVPFVSFDPLDEEGEADLVSELWAWLSDLRERAEAEGLTVRIYAYAAASVEGSHLRRIGASLPIAADVDALLASDEWVDLFPYMKRKYMSNEGHGLKAMATAAGFAWRDDDPGGFASMQWYRDAMAGIDREPNIARILAYNEDDCAATAALR